MIIQKKSDSKGDLFTQTIFESKKLTWKDKFKRDLFRENLKLIESTKSKKRREVREQDQKRASSKNLSKLFDKNAIYLEDNQEQFSQHGHYSAYIPLAQQSKLDDQLKTTFPYIEYLTEKNHQQTRSNIYNQISTHIRNCVQKNSVEIGWKSCLKKFMCDLDVIKAIQIYVEILKYGTKKLDQLHLRYGNGCSKQVFFHRVCQASKYYKESIKINKNIKTSIQTNEQISQVSLPKTSKCLFCSICLLYDCNQHNIDDAATQFNYQYLAKSNIIPEQTHVTNILSLISFQKSMITSDFEEGALQNITPHTCSQNCYKNLNKQTYSKKNSMRRPIISLVHRSMINLAIDIFSYDPCLIYVWCGKQLMGQNTSVNKGISCENIFFYLMQENNIYKKLQYKFYKSEQQYLKNEPSRPNDQLKINFIPHKKRKEKLKFDHDNNENYRIGCCFHYFIGQEPFDHNCQRCCCKKRGFCLPQCQCPPQCSIRKQGCQCKGKDQCRSKKCPCFQSSQQCIPGLCKNCFNSSGMCNKKNSCENSMILRQMTKNVKIGDSNICGLGAFAGEDIPKEDLVVIYTGEMIEHAIDYIRQGLRLDQTFYNFGLNEGGSVDARFMGNKSRFINHQKGGDQNLQAFRFFSQGRFKTAMYAKKNIKKGEQLFFNYDVEGIISKNFPGKYDFIKKGK